MTISDDYATLTALGSSGGVPVILIGQMLWHRLTLNRNSWYFSDELHVANRVFQKWVEEGRVKRVAWPTSLFLLAKLCGDPETEQGCKRLEAIAGPNGWVVYNMLLQQRRVSRLWFWLCS